MKIEVDIETLQDLEHRILFYKHLFYFYSVIFMVASVLFGCLIGWLIWG